LNIDIAFLAFALVAWLPFRFCRPAVAAAIVFFGGWVLLPVGHYAPGSAEAVFPFWITGLAVPSDMLLTKAWVAPAAAVAGAALFDSATLRRWRPGWVDLPMAAWCAWPLAQTTLLSLATDAVARPSGALASLYLAGAWGLPWILGRIYFTTVDGQRLLARAMTASALACLPFSVIEGIVGPMLYDHVYETHPLRADGAERYLGFRPLGFFEDGNQFGIWIALSALAALWLAVALRDERFAARRRTAATVVVVMALAAQSLGALLMLAIGAAFLGTCRFLRPRATVIVLLAGLAIGGAIYVSGIVPVMRIGKDTVVGRQVVDAFRSVGRGSFAWRISQDQKLLADARENIVLGSATWDWWRPKGTRPWGLSMLLLGQFGVVGLVLGMGSLLWPALRVAWMAPRASGWRAEALPLMLATIIVMAALDGLLNSFFFFPAIVAAGALARSSAAGVRARGEIVRVPARTA
jgi:hypothetical protein